MEHISSMVRIVHIPSRIIHREGASLETGRISARYKERGPSIPPTFGMEQYLGGA